MNSDRALSPIPTPFRVRWGLFRSRWLPVVTMGVCALLSVWMWTRVAASGQATGEVERVKVSLSSAVDGRIGFLPGKQITLLQRVDVDDVVARLDDTLVKSQLNGATAERDLLKGQLDALKAAPASADTAARMASLASAITAKEELMGQLDLKLDSLVVKSPIAGTVTSIHARPGQFVSAGLPILDIAAEHGTSVVAYLRADQRILPKVGAKVEVRTSSDPHRPITCEIESVGGQFDTVPARLLRDPKYPEWGLPVRITLPPDVAAGKPGAPIAKPGETVHILFNTRSTAVAAADDETPGKSK